MKKDTQFTLRIPTDLKKALQTIAAQEQRSVAQVCEIFLKAGSEGYKREGSKFLRRFLLKSKWDCSLESGSGGRKTSVGR